MNDELKEKIYKILNDLPSESPCLDYKLEPYKENERAEFIKDLNAFLNSIDGYGNDKFIIIGVLENKDSHKYIRKGIKTFDMNDDNFYQISADYISPRPSLETGKVKYPEDSQDEFGYIYIPGDKNNDRVYTINKDCPNEGKYAQELNNKIKSAPMLVDEFHQYIDELKKIVDGKKVYASTSWIRWGSTSKILTEYDRRKIYEENHKPKIDYLSIDSSYYDLYKVDNSNNLLKMSILVGGWNETYDGDKQIISEIFGQPYETLIKEFRNILTDKDSPILYKNESWQIKDKINLIKSFASKYFKEDILKFQTIAIKVLTEIDSKFNLSSDKRAFANIYSSKSKYSELLKKSIAETLAIISSIIKEFSNSSEAIKNLSYYVISAIFEKADWKLLASLESIMPLLAEADYETFLKMWENIIVKDSKTINQFMESNEIGIIENHYTTGLYWALQLIAWEERYLIRTLVLLSQLSKYDKRAIDNIVGIILPWHPQTKASVEVRMIAVENIIKENEECGWRVISELMPNKRTIGSPSYKPKWNNLINDGENDSVLKKEYWEQIKNYLVIYIKYSKTNINRLCDLIDLMDDLPKSMFNMIISKLSKKNIKEISEEKRYILWDHIEDFINRHVKFATEKWALPPEALDEIKKIACELKPTSKLIYNKRYFRKDSWNLYDDKIDYKESEKKLQDIRVNIIKEINAISFESVMKFVNAVEDAYVIGICYAEIMNKTKDENKVLKYLDSNNENEVLFSKGFVYKKHIINGYNWLNKFDINKWNENKIVNLLVVLPNNQITWDLVSKFLSHNQIIYWKIVDIRFIDEDIDINYPMKKLLEAERPAKAISILDFTLRKDKTLEYDRNYAMKALKDILKKQDELNNLDMYHIKDIIKDLQNSNVSKDELFNIEWAYLNLLTDMHGDVRPITMEKELSANPEKYNEILSLAYKKHSSKKEDAEFVDEKIATNAYRLLNIWKICPGLTENDTINKSKLNKWYKKMKELCTKSDRLEVGLLNFGHVLYHAPKDKSGLWIDKNVAELLNAEDAEIIREGYRTEAFNSLGVVTIDKDGIVFDNESDKYEEKAKSVEKAGYSRIATVMRNLSDSYRKQAEDTRKRYQE